jgi:hypothetical protein
MTSDVRLSTVSMEGKNTEMITVRLKNPKEARGTSVTVEMFANGAKWCPVKAYKLWKRTTFLVSRMNTVLLRKEDGSCYTGREFNAHLKTITKNMAKLEGESYSSHSFRAGMATMMARLGYSDPDIQRQGRWASEAFLKYIKLGRATRWRDQMRLSAEIAKKLI